MGKVNGGSPNTRDSGIPWRHSEAQKIPCPGHIRYLLCGGREWNSTFSTYTIHDIMGRLRFVSVKGGIIFSWWCTESIAN